MFAPCAEELVAGAADHDHVNGGVHARVEHRRVDLAHHLVQYVFAGGSFSSMTATPSAAV